MKLTIKLNLKSIIKAEQFLNKPFPLFDYTNETDLKGFLYCLVLMNNPETFTYEEFTSLLETEKISGIIVKQFEKHCKVMAQFSQVTDGENKGTKEEAGEPTYIKDIVSCLILEGLNPFYVMNELQVSDLSMFLAAYKRKKQSQMEEKRLWTFLTCAPHIDLKKVKNAVDFYPLPWELEQLEKERQEFIKANEKNLERFLNEGINFINPDNNK